MSLKFRNPKARFFFGMLFLVLANTWHWYAQRIAHVSEGLTDGVFGLFMGLAIGTLIFAIARRGRRNCEPRQT